MKKIIGAVIPAVTPFDGAGDLRIDWMRQIYDRWNRTRVAGYMSLGSNGEFRALSDDESVVVLKAASEAASPEKVFIAGVGRESLRGTLDFLRRLEAARLRTDYVSVLTPHYFRARMTDEALVGYFTAIADRSPWPVLLYCAPGFANGVCVSPEALCALADHPNIAGIKDTSKDQMEGYLAAVGSRKDFTVMAGSIGNLKTCVKGGGTAGVLSCANYFPNLCARVASELLKDPETPLYPRVKALAASTGGLAGVSGVKAVMGILGYPAGVPRLPVLPCGEALQAEMRSAVEAVPDLLEDDVT